MKRIALVLAALTAQACLLDASEAIADGARGRGRGRSARGVPTSVPVHVDLPNVAYRITEQVGQSNMKGYDGNPALSGTVLNPGKVLRVGASLPLCNAVEGNVSNCPTAGGPGQIPPSTGIYVEQPLTAAGDTLVARDSSKIYVFGNTAAQGGSSWAVIEKGGSGTYYADTWTPSAGHSIYDTTAALVGGGNTVSIQGLHLVHQESNHAEGTCSTYGARALKYVDDARADSLAIPGLTYYPFKFYAIQFANFSKVIATDTHTDCTQSLNDAAEAYPDKIHICAAGWHHGSGTARTYVPPATSTVHRNNVGYQTMAEQLADCEDRDTRLGVGGPGFLPASISLVSGNTSRIDVNYCGRVPCSLVGDCVDPNTPLVFDTTHIAAPSTGDQPNNLLQGFELDCPGPQGPYATAASIGGTGNCHVFIDTSAPVQNTCELHLGYRAIANSLPGNGFGNVEPTEYGSQRATLADNRAGVGPRSGQNIISYAPPFSHRPIGGVSVSPPSSSSTLIEDRGPWMAGWDVTHCPSAGGAWSPTYGNVTMAYGAGTWSCGQSTGALASASIGSARVNQALDSTDGSEACWGQTGTGHHDFDVAEDEDIYIELIGMVQRGDSVENLFRWQGDTGSTNNRFQATINNTNGTLTVSHDTSGVGGVSVSFGFTLMVPDGGTNPTDYPNQWSHLSIYIDAKGAPNGMTRYIVCHKRVTNDGSIASTCSTRDNASKIKALSTGNLCINGPCPCNSGSAHRGKLISFTWAKGQKAQSLFRASDEFQAAQTALYNGMCASPPCT